MSKRTEQYGSSVKNPATKFIEWSSDNNCFKFYNRETKQEELIPLPLKIVHLSERHTVRGYNKANQCGVYSNEVGNITKEPVHVRTFKGDASVKGIYKEIKGDIVQLGGKYAKVVYALFNGEIVSITLVGTAQASWSDFVDYKNGNRSKFATHYISVESFVTEKNGRNTYTKPVFTLGEEVDEETIKNADQSFDVLDIYFASKGTSSASTEDDTNPEQEEVVNENDYAPVAVGEDEDDLPF